MAHVGLVSASSPWQPPRTLFTAWTCCVALPADAMNTEVLHEKQVLWSRSFLELLKEDFITSLTLSSATCSHHKVTHVKCGLVTAQEAPVPPLCFPGCSCAHTLKAAVSPCHILPFLRSLLFLSPNTFCFNDSLQHNSLCSSVWNSSRALHLSSSRLSHPLFPCFLPYIFPNTWHYGCSLKCWSHGVPWCYRVSECQPQPWPAKFCAHLPK